MIINIEIVAVHRSCLAEHPGFWAMDHGSTEIPQAGDLVRFLHLGEEVESGLVLFVDSPGECLDPKWEYFTDRYKISFVPSNFFPPYQQDDRADWTGISPISRVNGVPNNWRGEISKAIKNL